MNAAKPGDLKAVLDTNVYFSAFSNSRGVPYQAWQQALRGKYKLLASPPIIRELADVLRHDLRWSESGIILQLKLVVRMASIVDPRAKLHVIVDDPDDDRILECAVAGKADLIVSGDRHLNRLKNFQGIGIVRPVDFLRILGS